VTDRAIEIGDFRFTETSHVPDTRLGSHRHAHPAITFVLHGGFVEDFGRGRALDCAAMSILLKPADAMHANRYSMAGARSFILECNSESSFGKAVEACAPQLVSARFVVPTLELYSAFRTNAPEREVLAEQLVLETSRGQCSHQPWRTIERPRWLDRVAAAVSDGCLRSVRLTTLANDAGVHPVYLARAFRRHYGTSIGGFMLQCRIRLAMRRLATSADSISQIALECAFADQAHFTRLFRREAGMPPGQFRRVARRCSSAA
jgi:AraC family transcriptional regulator